MVAGKHGMTYDDGVKDERPKDEAAVALGSRGGKARAARLRGTPRSREIAAMGAAARWAGHTPKRKRRKPTDPPSGT